MTSNLDSGIATTLRLAREAVGKQMNAFEKSGLNWQEESLTSELLSQCWPQIKFATFTREEEGTTGGDWLWWWIDDRDEAFGMVVQAKRLHEPSRIDFQYNGGQQRRSLFETADELQLPPMYALYLGTASFRRGMFCRAKPPLLCDYCDAAAVSMVPALLTSAGGGSPRDQMTFAIESSTPLEWLAEPWRPVLKWDANFQMLDDELKSWIVEPQDGARGIARRVFDRVVRVRAGAMSDGRSDLLTERGADRVFETLPQDYGHFSVPFHEHVLRGLRTEAPDYVLDVAHDLELEGPPHPGLAGVAVIRC